MMALHQHHVPFALVLGVASSPDTVHSLITRPALGHLNMERFLLRSPATILPQVLEYERGQSQGMLWALKTNSKILFFLFSFSLPSLLQRDNPEHGAAVSAGP
jgi:hypothetical protein